MRKRRNPLWAILVGVFWVVLLVAGCFAGIAVEPQEAIHALEVHGFSEIQIQEKIYFFPAVRGCDRGDAALFRARAKNPVGKLVDVIVCVGWPFKGATVRVP